MSAENQVEKGKSDADTNNIIIEIQKRIGEKVKNALSECFENKSDEGKQNAIEEVCNYVDWWMKCKIKSNFSFRQWKFMKNSWRRK